MSYWDRNPVDNVCFLIYWSWCLFCQSGVFEIDFAAASVLLLSSSLPAISYSSQHIDFSFLFLFQPCNIMLIACLSNKTQLSMCTFLICWCLCANLVSPWLFLWFNEALNSPVCFQTGGSLQQKADGWKEKVNETKGSRSRTPTHVDQEVQVLTPLLFFNVSYCFIDHS